MSCSGDRILNRYQQSPQLLHIKNLCGGDPRSDHNFFFPVSKYIDMPSTLLTYSFILPVYLIALALFNDYFSYLSKILKKTYSFLYLVKIHERSTILLGYIYKSQTCGRQSFYNEVIKEKDAISDSLLEGCHSISFMWCRFQFLKLVKIM